MAAGLAGFMLITLPMFAQEKPADDGNLPEQTESKDLSPEGTEAQAKENARFDEAMRESNRHAAEMNYKRWEYWLGPADYDFLERMGADRISYLLEALDSSDELVASGQLTPKYGRKSSDCAYLRAHRQEAGEWLRHLDQITAERGSPEAAARDLAYEKLKELIGKYTVLLGEYCD